MIVGHLANKPSRAYFADLFRKGCFKSGIEVGVASGRFSEHVLSVNKEVNFVWHMIEPLPNEELKKRFAIFNGTANFRLGSWAGHGIGQRAHIFFWQYFSTDPKVLRDIPDEGVDFIYLDGAHDYKNVKLELPFYYDKLQPGGVLAGHDYCNYGESSLSCSGCENVPRCGKYTDYGISHGKPDKIASNQAGVVSAVQEWLVEAHPELTLYHTIEDFTRESLEKDGMDFGLVVTNTRNPSWFVIKPEK